MCGIAGIFDMCSTRPIDEALLRRMNDLQRHRGPDGEGYHVEPGLGFAHRRLSIIDLDGGRQPQFNEDGHVVVVFNGEIYNYRGLREELAGRGHRFVSASDTEVIVHGWEEWGEACLDRFRGMYAFALWDRGRQRFFLARDRLGVKPLQYAVLPDGHLIFASELKALLAHPGLSRTIDPCAVEEYFAFGYVPDPRTIFRGALKLEPGHALSIGRGGSVAAPRRYWNVHFEEVSVRSEQEVEQEFVDRFRDAVGARLIADVPLGAFLSGGVDSSAVVAMMAEQSSEPVTTCSIASGHAEFDESRYASQVARRYRTRHHVETVDAEDQITVDELAAIYDEPFADSSAIPTYRVSKVARRHVTVALSGDGGDEGLAGYRRYPWHLTHESYRSAVPRMLSGAAFRAAQLMVEVGTRWPSFVPGQVTLTALTGDATDGYLELISVAPSPRRRRLFSDALRRDLQGYRAHEVLRRHAADAPADPPLSRVQYLDLKTYLPGDILAKVDRASMANGLEVRSPFLDHQLLEWLCRVPAELKLRGGEGKYLLKRALKDRLPADVLCRPKRGFGVPLAEWLRGPLRQHVWDAIDSDVLNDSGLISGRELRTLMREHESSRRDHASLLWAVIVFEAFLRRIQAASGRFSLSEPSAA